MAFPRRRPKPMSVRARTGLGDFHANVLVPVSRYSYSIRYLRYAQNETGHVLWPVYCTLCSRRLSLSLLGNVGSCGALYDAKRRSCSDGFDFASCAMHSRGSSLARSITSMDQVVTFVPQRGAWLTRILIVSGYRVRGSVGTPEGHCATLKVRPRTT